MCTMSEFLQLWGKQRILCVRFWQHTRKHPEFNKRRKRMGKYINQWNNGALFFSTNGKNKWNDWDKEWLDWRDRMWRTIMNAKWLRTCLLGRVRMGWCPCHEDSEMWLVTRGLVPGVSLAELQLKQKCRSSLGTGKYGCHWTQLSPWAWMTWPVFGSSRQSGEPHALGLL